ncbi:uncharacterized protein LOC129809379 [Phlebotomus papatasi]|uniref:uncharacterized protein LOC129809379 n=1 Tax=Phlebotomus papatasi TaxID=29031 RepID=UPI002483DDCF|nr:uncharacterized protein LOC129809379 [Phlebotomus papatasi]
MDQHTEPHRVLHRVEKEFAETHSRTEDGRYVVQLPFKGNPSELGDSKKQAMARFINMEKKFATNEQLRKDYSEFIHEYISLGHMSLAPPDGGKYYLLHHAVFKKESSTTKTRVVFDASCKTSTGKSLNSVLHAGPKLQQNLNQIIIRWCKYKYVYTADIEKMFRQIIVAEGHRDYLRILWRDSPKQPIREYRLNTVTYGTAPATYLSVKVLMQLAEDEGAQFSAAVAAIKDFYVDDVMTGADTVEGALQIQNELINLLQKGGMNLRKWTSNKPELLANLSEEQIEAKYLQLTENETLTALGVGWDPNTDQFSYKIKPTPRSGQMDKRIILSDLASIYDPIGWLAPVTIRARLIMQRACKDQVDWNKPVSKGIVDDWKEFLRNLPEVEKIRIPRYMN